MHILNMYMSGNYILLFVFSGILLSSISLSAQDKPVMRGVGTLNAPEVLEQGNNYLFVIGIDDYPNWFRLDNAVSDARGIQEVLMEQFGFQPAVDPLYNKEATKENIQTSFDQLRALLKPEDDLIVFYAGHGETRRDSVGDKIVETGYIIPYDGAPVEEQRWSTYLGIQELMSEAARLPARHITMILDACHSGIALGEAATRFRNSTAAPPASLVNKLSRRVITSAQGEQLASDQGPVGDHSLFTGMLIQGLGNGLADLDEDGLITSTELGFHLQQSVSRYSGDLQTPDFGTFQLDERGDLVLRLNDNTPAILMQNANSQWRNAKMADFINTVKKLEQIDSTDIQFLYLMARYHLLQADVDGALAALEKRAEQEQEKLPEQYKSLLIGGRQEISHSLLQWKNFIQFNDPAGPEMATIELLIEDIAVSAEEARGKGKRFNLKTGDTYRFRIRNNSDRPLYIYGLYVDRFLRMRPLNLWEDQMLYARRGIQPGETVTTYPFRNDGFESLEFIKFFFSPEPVYIFLNPRDHLTVIKEPYPCNGNFKTDLIWMVFKEI